jgi:predicted RNase H-like HicB family nuclease
MSASPISSWSWPRSASRRSGAGGSHRIFRTPGRDRATQPARDPRSGQALPGAPGRRRDPPVQFAAGGRAVTPYPIQVYRSDEDRAWVADVPDLPYCSAHGPTPHDAVAEVEVAAAAWLEAAKATGRPLPEPSLRRARGRAHFQHRLQFAHLRRGELARAAARAFRHQRRPATGGQRPPPPVRRHPRHPEASRHLPDAGPRLDQLSRR